MTTTVTASQIQALYVAYFNRPADPIGLQFWLDKANAAGGVAAVANGFSGSPEYTAQYPAGTSYTTIVNQIYQNLFGRPAEPAGLVYWANQLAAGTIDVGHVAYIISQSAQGADLIAVQDKVAAATAFTASLNTTAAITSYDGSQAAAVASTWLSKVVDDASLNAAIAAPALAAVTASVEAAHAAQNAVSTNLTTGVDHLVGGAGNDNFIAVDGQWSALDTIDGGAGVNSLTVAQTAAITGAPAGVTLTNIQTLSLISGGGITANVASLGSVATLNITAGGASQITAAATTDVNELNSTNESNIEGGNNVTIVHGTANNTFVDSAAGAVNVTSNNAGGFVVVTKSAGPVTVAAKGGIYADGTTLAASIIGAVSHADQLAHVAAAAAAVTAEAATFAALGNARVVAGDLVALSVATALDTTVVANNAHTLGALNSGDITVAQKVAIDTAFATALAAGTSADAVTAAQAVEATLISAANSAVAAATTADNAATTLGNTTAGVVNTDNAANALVAIQTDNLLGTTTTLTSVTATGNYNGSVTFDDTTTAGVLTSVTLDNAGTALLTGQALTTIAISDGKNNVTVVNTTLGHADSLTLTADSAGTFTDANAATLNIVSNGTSTNVVGLIAIDATAVNLTGTAGLNFGDVSTGNLASNAVITATGDSGTNTITISSTQSYLGGSGADVVTLGSVAQAAAVSGGAGTADKLIITDTTAYGSNAAAALITGFEILQDNTSQAIDVTDLSGNTFTSIILNNANASVSGLNAAQAANVTLKQGVVDPILDLITLGVTGATNVGQLDTVHLTAAGSHGAAVDLGFLSIVGVETLNLTASTNVSLRGFDNAAAITNINVDGAGDVAIHTGANTLNVNTIIDAHAATGNVTIDASGSNGYGIKIIGSTTGTNDLVSNGLDSVLVGGSGNDTLTGGAGNDTITAGDGNNTIDGGAGADTITAGNGYNTIANEATTGSVHVTVGTGSNFITLGEAGGINGVGNDAVYHVTLGAHTAVAGPDYITVGTAGAHFGTTTANYVITGAVAGDDISIAGDSAVAFGHATVVTSTGSAGSLAADLSALVGAATGAADTVAYVVSHGNTYVAESNGGVAADGTTLTLIELVGVHTVTGAAANGHIIVG